MGTHYSLNKEAAFLEKRFGAKFDQLFESVYHVSGFDNPLMPVILDETPDRFSFLSWGLVPFWLKDREQLDQIRLKTLNARADTLFDKPSFKVPARKRRCLIITDGYFEWREVSGTTYPYYIHKKDGDAFALAGIWDEWQDEESGKRLRTFSLISVAANAFISKINNRHQRMPVILPCHDEKTWLRPDLDDEEIKSMLKPYKEGELAAYPVKRLIGKTGIESNAPEILEKYHYEAIENIEEKTKQEKSKQLTLF